MLGYPVLRLEPTREAVQAARERQGRPLLGYTRVPVDDVAVTHSLVAEGMLPVEVSLTLARRAGDLDVPDRAVGPMREGEENAVVELAVRSLRTSRFHLDPMIPDTDAERVKREWARNCVRGERGVEVLVARADGGVAGFLAVVSGSWNGEPSRAIDLVAVDERSQVQGIGRALVAAFVSRHGGPARWLTVGTQAGNHRSLALYGTCGFRIVRSDHVLHLHLGA